MVLGILGEYLGRIFDEVKGRPHFVLRDQAGWLSVVDEERSLSDETAT